MKNLLLLFSFIGIVFSISSCAKDRIVSTYKLTNLIEINGGDWSDFEFKKTLVFRHDGTINILNGNICRWGDEDESVNGTYDESLGIIQADCSKSYELSEDEVNIFITYPGIEFTYETYTKIE